MPQKSLHYELDFFFDLTRQIAVKRYTHKKFWYVLVRLDLGPHHNSNHGPPFNTLWIVSKPDYWKVCNVKSACVCRIFLKVHSRCGGAEQ